MAQGNFALFNEFTKYIGDGSHDLDNNTFYMMLITEQVGGTPGIAVTDLTPDSGDYTEVAAGGGYAANGALLTGVTWTHNAGTTTFDFEDVLWTSAGAGDPTTIKTALVYNSSHAGTNNAIGFIDMTTDGVTAISLLTGNITVSLDALGLFTQS